MDWNVMFIVAGALMLLFFVLKLDSSRLQILFRASDQNAAIKQL